MWFRSILEKIKNLFSSEGRPDIGLIILFCLINLLVLANSILQHPKIGYDVTGNINYIQILMHRLPGPEDTNEFFSPPAPYFLPAVYDTVCNQVLSGPRENLHGIYVIWMCRTYEGKFAQALNFLLSIGTTLLMLMIAELMRPRNRTFKLTLLLLLALLTVYFKTFSQVRAEPYVAFFIVLSVYWLIRVYQDESFKLSHVFALGISLGLLVLSRQWGFFLYPAIGLVWLWSLLRDRAATWRFTKAVAAGGLISFVVGGWFYIHLYVNYGSFTQFNIDTPGFSISNLPAGYFTSSGLKDFLIFKEPIRPVFDTTFFPVFYSDTWGDYWGYFTYYKQNTGFGSNEKTIAPYLGRVNLLDILPSLLLAGGVGFCTLLLFRRKLPATAENFSLALVTLTAITSFAGFLWFVISYYPSAVSVNKAAYIVQLFLMLVFPGAELMERIRARAPIVYWILFAALGIILIHNLPGMITNYKMFRVF